MGLKKDSRVEELFDRLSLLDKSIKKSDTARSVASYIEASGEIDAQIESLSIQMERISAQIKGARGIQRQAKETSDILLSNGPNRISLILKNQSGNDYIKARCYWRGKQREVQIAPLSGIVSHLTSFALIDPHKISHVLSENPTWDTCRSDPSIYDAILSLARIKFQRYIVDRIDQLTPSALAQGTTQHSSSHTSTSKSDIDPEKGSWYETWRERTGG